jgi:hypothetical protein
MSYNIITNDTGEEVCRSAIRSALDPTMKNLCEDPIKIDEDPIPLEDPGTIDEDPISLEDILSPTEAISTKIKSDAMNHVQGTHFSRLSTDSITNAQNMHFRQPSPAPKAHLQHRRQPNMQQRHERRPKLRDMHPKDPTTAPSLYPKRNNRTVKSGQTLTYSDDTPVVEDNISIPPIDPTTPTANLQQQFLRSCDTHITDQPDSFVYLRENGENENTNPIWKEFEVTLRDGNGNVKLNLMANR